MQYTVSRNIAKVAVANAFVNAKQKHHRIMNINRNLLQTHLQQNQTTGQSAWCDISSTRMPAV